MNQLVQFRLDDGGEIVVEVDDDEPGIERASRVDEVIVEAGISLEQSLERIRIAADAALSKMRGFTERPDRIELQFGVRFNAQAGAIIARTQAEGHLQVTLSWHQAGSAYE